ncbi:hypothetical protein NDU88_006645 [Pleurodeles waltl]|uniref:Uncharacterized protein n=1 Tax=Pleurodeles waltl TaxID=8319 RepID=A0AAV7VMH3_PLEWA|nr:hypothetical protein NDU88_006645 [Pleurodeles waltl]
MMRSGCRYLSLASWIERASESRSIHTDIAGFQDRVTELDRRLSMVEDKLNQPSDKDQELQYLRDKLTDFEDGSRRDNVHFFGIPEWAEGTDARIFLKDTLPILTGLTFSPPLELQRAHRMAPLQRSSWETTHNNSLLPLARTGAPTVNCHPLTYDYEGHEL